MASMRLLQVDQVLLFPARVSSLVTGPCFSQVFVTHSCVLAPKNSSVARLRKQIVPIGALRFVSAATKLP